jgi:L-fuconolactonase
MPNFPIVDAHLHLWDPQHFRMAWVDGEAQLNKPYGISDYVEHTAGVPIEAMVYLEVDVAPHYGLLEAAWVAERAKEDPRLKAIVATAPLEYGEQTRAYLQALVKTSPLVRGVRRLVQQEPDLNFQTQPRFVRGVQLLAEFDLSFDICIRAVQLPATIALVKRCPQTRFILDHIGKPDIAKQVLQPWRDQIFELARLPNIVCKVSGMVTEADHARWQINDLKPFFETVYEAFGEDRVVYGGDWPVCTLAASYKRWVETLDALTDQLSDAAKRKLWNTNAKTFYRIA